MQTPEINLSLKRAEYIGDSRDTIYATVEINGTLHTLEAHTAINPSDAAFARLDELRQAFGDTDWRTTQINSRPYYVAISPYGQ